MEKVSKKTEYYFILGGNPALSLAEINALFKIQNKKFIFDFQKNLKILCKEFLIISSKVDIEVNKLINILGGTIKIGIITKNCKSKIKTNDLIYGLNINKNKKFYFGFSFYGKVSSKLDAKIRWLAMDVKKELKKRGISSRWVISKEKQLSSVIVKKNRLVGKNGVEWCILKDQDKMFLGRTLAVQDFEDYSKRDYERPKRDAKSGMIPPKLAKIMINLARAELDHGSENQLTLLDPFCGSGTILQEAAILKIDKLIGGDLNKKAVKDTKQNLKWLEKNMDLKINATIHQIDVKKLSNLIPKNSIDMIVTEPYLGRPLWGNENIKTIYKIIMELNTLYLSAFKEFKKILKGGGVICAIFPVFIIKNKQKRNNKFLPIFDDIKKIGFNPISFNLSEYNFDKNINRYFRIEINKFLNERKNIIYGRKGQKVWREIVIFKL